MRGRCRFPAVERGRGQPPEMTGRIAGTPSIILLLRVGSPCMAAWRSTAMSDVFEQSTTFEGESTTLRLLRHTAESALSADLAAQLQLAESDLLSHHAAILVVDDEAAIRHVMTLTLKALGYHNLAEAADGLDALQLLREREFDLLITDFDMPGMDGFALLAEVKNDPFLRHVPVLIASGMNELESVARCIEIGAEDYLPKPVNTTILRARVTASLDRKRLRDVDRLRVLGLQQEKQLLELEKEKSERLLLNILPEAIAERLKQGERTIAERHADVTVLFADIVSFTALTSDTEPEALVALLNDLFSRFDRLAEAHGVEKIKTIGDCYLAVGGLPVAQPNHVENVAQLALEFLAAVAQLNQERGTRLEVRIGVNSGPVIAGVIGRKKFTYDLWGEAVNLANRIQSSGLPSQVNVSAGIHDRLQGRFQFMERGTIECKGVGKVRTYILLGKLR